MSVPVRDRLLALFVAVCWGVNFPATALALQHFPPLFLVALRFSLVALPTLLFIPRPRVELKWLLGFGLGTGLMQFAFLYLGMAAGMPSGLASLVLQASAPFTVIMAALWLHEKITRRQALGIGMALLGLGLIAFHRAQFAALFPVMLTVCAALGWAIGNISSRQAKEANPFHLMMWMSVIPPIPMLILSLIIEGPATLQRSVETVFSEAALPSIFGLLYIVLIATVVGYGIWTNLMSRFPSSVVAPFSLLVPIVGVFASWLAFGETVDLVEFCAGIIVIGGVLFASYRKRVTLPISE